jgi:hypothetical protein
MELVGLGYSSWFVYRYLLFKARPQPRPARPRSCAACAAVRRSPRCTLPPSACAARAPCALSRAQESRKELVADVEELKAKIAGKSE